MLGDTGHLPEDLSLSLFRSSNMVGKNVTCLRDAGEAMSWLSNYGARCPCLDLNRQLLFEHGEAFSCRWRGKARRKRIVGARQEIAGSWREDERGLSWQITTQVLSTAIADPDRAAVKPVFDVTMSVKKSDIAAIKSA